VGEGIEGYRIIPEGVSPLQASWRSLPLPQRSVGWILTKTKALKGAR